LAKMKKIRDVVYGFVFFDEQEQAIIDHPAFQRLRRIKQLSLTDMVYPGATHTRFEHCVGVMQMASDMYDSIVRKEAAKEMLKDFSLTDEGVSRYRKIVRLAAQEAIPEEEKKRYEHEEYSIAMIKTAFKGLIEEHNVNNNFKISVGEVTALLGDNTVKLKGVSLLWKELISGQLDADRADYLLRDSIHLGVNYGLYDRSRLVSCMTLARTETDAPVLAIEDGGWHIAESLVIARYQMFAQVYFHND